jgi:predicted PurR-regulated permease PerM
LICAVLAWVPYVGSILGGLLVVLVAATDFPGDPAMAYWAIALFGLGGAHARRFRLHADHHRQEPASMHPP